jgi:hypothetical protein
LVFEGFGFQLPEWHLQSKCGIYSKNRKSCKYYFYNFHNFMTFANLWSNQKGPKPSGCSRQGQECHDQDSMTHHQAPMTKECPQTQVLGQLIGVNMQRLEARELLSLEAWDVSGHWLLNLGHSRLPVSSP